MLTLWYPTESISHSPDKQVSMTVSDGGTQQQLTATKCSLIEKVRVHHTITIEQHPVDTDHQYTTLVTNESRHCAIRRHKFLYLTVRIPPADSTTMARFPKSALFIDKDIAEIVGIALGIAFQLLTAVIADIKTEQSIAGRSNQQMILVFLQDIVDTGHTFGTFQSHVYKLVVGIIITIQTFLRSHPKVSS